MYSIITTSRYRRSFKRISKHKDFKREVLETVIDLLACDEQLPRACRDHALTGTLAGFRECHIAGDILLVYSKEEKVLILVLADIGSHSSLFGG